MNNTGNRLVADDVMMRGVPAARCWGRLLALPAVALLVTSMLATPRTALAESLAGHNALTVAGQESAGDLRVGGAEQGSDTTDADAKFQQYVALNGSAAGMPSEPGAYPASEAPRNGIPMVTVFIDESKQAIADARASDPDNSYGTFADLNKSRNHSTRATGAISVLSPEGYVGEYGQASVPEGELKLEYIRGRGTSTWEDWNGPTYKRAYKLKFAGKQDFFGMGASKEWALMANAYDDSLVHNRISLWLAGQIGMPYQPQMVPVDVTLVRVKDGRELERTFLGNYCLSELVDTGEGRVDIGKLKKDVVSDNADDEENITGGYLFSRYDSERNGDEPAANVVHMYGMSVFTRSPQFEDGGLPEGQAAQQAYIRDYLSRLDNLVLGDDFDRNSFIDDERHDAIAELMDMRSTADYWWMQEVMGNADAYGTSSTYLYKPRNGKLCWGPIWDCDLAWRYGVEGFVYAYDRWISALRNYDPRFVELLKERWKDPLDGLNVKLQELTRPGGILDAYREEIGASWEENNALYPDRTSPYLDKKGRPASVDEAIEEVRTWVDQRRDWIDKHLDEVGAQYVTVSYVSNGRELKREHVDIRYDHPSFPEDPVCGSNEFVGWCVEGTDEVVETPDVTQDTVFVAKFRPMELETGVGEGWDPFPNEVLFLNGAGIEPIEDGRVAYRASVLLPSTYGYDWRNSHMTFVVQPKNAAPKRVPKTVEIPLDKAIKGTSDSGRTILTFELPLSAIEMGQTIESVFNYKRDGKPDCATYEETLESQLDFHVKWGGGGQSKAYAKALHDYGCTAYDFFRLSGNGNVTEDNYSAMGGSYADRFDWEGAKAGLHQELEGIGASKSTQGSQVKKMSMSLRCDSEATVEITVEAKPGVENFTAYATYKGERIEGKRLSDTRYRISISGMRAQDLGELIEVCGVADGAYSMRCSALSYASAIMESDAYGVHGNDFMTALFNYYKAAKELAA